jgi:membrane-bound lytic murein transglycosylase MltF
MGNEKVFIHPDVLIDGKIRTVDMKSEVVDLAIIKNFVLSYFETRDKEGLVRCSRKTQLHVSDWDYVYHDAFLSAEMKRQKEINRLLDEIQRLRNLVFTLED